jgi:hypothetical protein
LAARSVADSGKRECVDPGEKGAILETGGPCPPEREKGQRREDVATWPLEQKTDSPQLQEMVMHRVSVIVHCTAVV